MPKETVAQRASLPAWASGINHYQNKKFITWSFCYRFIFQEYFKS
jgi:hypothetical protein